MAIKKKIFICSTIMAVITIAALLLQRPIFKLKHKCIILWESYQKADIDALERLDIPLLLVETEGQIEPSCTAVLSPTGWGQGIENAEYVSMNFTIKLHKKVICTSNNEKEGFAKIKIRGNTSAASDKKSFKIKLSEKRNLLGGEKKYADKEWVLLRTNGNLKTVIGLETNRLIGLPYTPRYKMVNLVFNNNYRGVYILIESVKYNKRCRVPISKDGYIIEYDAYWWQDTLSFKTKLCHDKLGYTIKYPPHKKLTDKDISYIKQSVENLEDSLESVHYEESMDLKSWASWILVHDLLGNWDGAGSNIFMCKYDKSDESKWFIPTTWDYDGIFDTQDKWCSIHALNDLFYYGRLFHHKNPAFVHEYVHQYNDKSLYYYREINKYLTDLEKSSLGKSLNESFRRDAQRWDNYGKEQGYKSLREEILNIRKWFHDREIWMSKQMSSLY